MGTNTYHVHLPIHSQRLIIDVIAKYVSKYGKPFEDELIKRIVSDQDIRYNFLVNSGTPENVYYKWKVYSLCQGDELNSWHTDPYWIFKSGSKWIPPNIIKSDDRDVKRESLNTQSSAHGEKNLPIEQRQLLIDKIDKLSSKRSSIRDAMIYIIEHSDYALEVSNILVDSILSDIDTSTKMNRIYLLNDVLRNSSSTQPSSWVYRTAFEKRLPEIFHQFSNLIHKSGKISRGLIIEKLYNLVKIWESWHVFSTIFIKALEFSLFGDNIELIDPIQLKPELLNDLLDGKELTGCDILYKLPRTHRKYAYKYVRLQPDQLKLACQKYGLYSEGSNEHLLLRLACFELYKNDDNNKTSSQNHSNIVKVNIDEQIPDPIMEIPSESNNEDIIQNPISEFIEIDRDFQESDMETVSD